VQQNDLEILFGFQLDPDASRMAAVPSRTYEEFLTRWAKSAAAETTTVRTILFRGVVAGHIVVWENEGKMTLGYWLGKEFWGKGIASWALFTFLPIVTTRPLYAHVAKHNVASLRVLQKSGFAVLREGKFTLPDGEECDEVVLILGEENAEDASEK
jgi:RimJ/RimL family protein N-acetyltransferase